MPAITLASRHKESATRSHAAGTAPFDYLPKSSLDRLRKINHFLIHAFQNSYQSQQAAELSEKSVVEFTERQLTILEMIAGGLTVKAIALKLKIKECTVNHHKKVIFNKLGVQSSTEAVSIASRMSYV